MIHIGHLVKGVLREGAKVKAIVDAGRRAGIRRAHSATHILHYALQKNLGSHAQQQGSKVDNDWLRFDFTNLAPVSPEQLDAISRDVTSRVAAAEPVEWKILPLADARKLGAMMLFGEKYPEPVRMVSMGSQPDKTFSRELCGGTHLDNTNEVECFEILAEEGVSAGTRRITALTGARAGEHIENTAAALEQAAKQLGSSLIGVPQGVAVLQSHARDLKKQISGGGAAAESSKAAKKPATLGEAEYEQVKHALAEAGKMLSVAPLAVPERIAAIQADVAAMEKQLAERQAAGPLNGEALLKGAEQIDGVTVVVAEVPGVESNLMRQLIDQVRGKTSASAVLLASLSGDDKVTLVAGISKDLQAANSVRAIGFVPWPRRSAGAVGAGPIWPRPAARFPPNFPKLCRSPRRPSARCSARKFVRSFALGRPSGELPPVAFPSSNHHVTTSAGSARRNIPILATVCPATGRSLVVPRVPRRSSKKIL